MGFDVSNACNVVNKFKLCIDKGSIIISASQSLNVNQLLYAELTQIERDLLS